MTAVPGSRPRQDHTAKVEEVATWDQNPRRYQVSSNEWVEYFPISALARALQRDVRTIHRWERIGWLPKNNFRGPRLDGIAGHRLYSRQFIEGVITIAREEGVLDDLRCRIGETDFPRRTRVLYAELMK